MAEMQKKKPQKSEIKKSEKDSTSEMSRAEKIARLKELESLLTEQESKGQQKNSESLEESVEKKVALAIEGTEISQKESLELEKELEALQDEIKEEEKNKIIQKSPFELLIEHNDWLEKNNYGFMFSIPERDEDLSSWKQEWSQVMLDYAKYFKKHILFLKALQTQKPFNKFIDRKKSLMIIAQELVDKKMAVWLDKKLFKKPEKLRVYWRSLEEWADIIMQWATENAVLDLFMVNEIRTTDTEFANLPDEDLKEILHKIEDSNRGEMVELSETEYGIKFKII